MKEILKKKSKMAIYREELLKIQADTGLTVETVIEQAQDNNSPLHDFFDWNNNEAGVKWRKHQARLLINYVIEPVLDENKDRVYSFEIIDTNGTKEYQHINEILSRSDWKNQILHQATSHLAGWQQKYEKYKLAELKPIISEIGKLDKKNGRKRKK